MTDINVTYRGSFNSSADEFLPLSEHLRHAACYADVGFDWPRASRPVARNNPVIGFCMAHKILSQWREDNVRYGPRPCGDYYTNGPRTVTVPGFGGPEYPVRVHVLAERWADGQYRCVLMWHANCNNRWHVAGVIVRTNGWQPGYECHYAEQAASACVSG